MGTPTSSGNRGVMALGSALVRLCLEARTGTEAFLLGSQRNAQPVTMRPLGQPVAVRVIPWRMSPKSHPRDHLASIFLASLLYRLLPIRAVRRGLGRAVPWIREVESATFVGDVRGGDSFSDIYGLKRFVIATIPVLSVILIRGEIVQFPQTYGPFRGGLARRIAAFVLKRSSTVIARDKESRRVAQELLGPGREVKLSPDVAFALHADDTREVELDAMKPQPLSADLIGVNVNGLMYAGGYNRKNMFGLSFDYPSFLAELLPALLAEHRGDLVLVPHTYAPAGDTESDNEACVLARNALAPDLQKRVRIVTGDYDAHQLKGIIRRCDFFIGSRMHSCIAALSQGVPCVGVAYSMKFAGVFDSVGMADHVIDARKTTQTDATRRIVELYRGRNARRAPLAAAADAARQELKRIFGQLVDQH